MTKPIKRLALLTAGALLSASLLSCGGAGGSSSSGVDKSDKQESGGQTNNGNTENGQTYDGLTPEGVYNAMLTADDFVAVTTLHRTYNGETVTGTLKMEKDENRVRLGETITDAEGSETDTMYYDLDTHYWYEQNDSGWVYETEEITLQALLADLTTESVEVLFEDDCYHPYDTTAGYLAKTASLDAFFGDSLEGAVYTLSMTPDAEGYTYLLSVITDEIVQTLELKVTFQAVSVTLPEVESAAPGSGDSNVGDGGNDNGGDSGNGNNPIAPDGNDPDQSGNGEAKPDKVGDDQVTGNIDTPVPVPTEGYLSPSKLFKTVLVADEIVIDVTVNATMGYSLQKTGNVALVTRIEYGIATSSIYYDLESGYGYNYINGGWNESYAAYDWASLLQQLGVTSTAYFFRDAYFGKFDEGDGKLSVDASLLEGSDVDFATWERSKEIYIFTETDTEGGTVSYVFRLNEDTDVSLPDMNEQ